MEEKRELAEFEENLLERIVSELDERGDLFPGFGLTKENNELKILGRGGFSTVYEMYDREHPESEYALKVTGLNRHIVSSERFWNTVEIQRNLCQDSDHVARIIDAKELTEQDIRLQFVLMEKLDSILLKDRFRKVSLSRTELSGEPEVIRFALEIGQALHAAHTCQILHRDIKLENIFWDRKEQRYQLGDFGVARFTESGNADTCIYTDGYGAPEIGCGVEDPYNAAADIYSFGITCYLLLNGLRFPGSDGYYSKVEVQYDPDFVFPAPENASVEMTRLIRKMCSYRPEDRCRSMAEVLTELALINRAGGREAADDLADQIDLATETYRGEDSPEKDEPDEKTEITEPKTRAERKFYGKLVDEIYREESIKYFAVITVLLTLFLKAVQPDAALAESWVFWVLSAAVLFEAILQRVGEFYILWGAAVVGLTGVSIYQNGLTIPHIVLLLAVAVGCPLLAASGALASGIWIVLSVVLKLPFLDFLGNHDLGWIALLACLLAVNRYFDMRIVWEKTTDTRAWLGKFVYAWIFPVMAAAGAVLWLLQRVHVLALPETIMRLHLIRTGVLGYGAMIFFAWWDGELDEDDDGEICEDDDGEICEDDDGEICEGDDGEICEDDDGEICEGDDGEMTEDEWLDE